MLILSSPVVSAPSGNWLEMPTLKPKHRPTKSETTGIAVVGEEGGVEWECTIYVFINPLGNSEAC